jgi:hypothetical protein
MTPHVVIGVDAGSATLRDADHLIQRLAAELALSEGVFGCTHLIRTGQPRVALSLALPDETAAARAREHLAREYPGTGTDTARTAAAGHRARTAGRAVLFPGARAMAAATPTVAELLAHSAIDAVSVLGSPGPPDGALRLVTRGHIRPEWRSGRLVLAAVPAAGGTLAPFEVPNPTPCCGDHGQ